MTRKDYIMLVAAIKRGASLGKHVSASDSEIHLAAVKATALNIADSLSEDNDRFDRDRFLKACGVQP